MDWSELREISSVDHGKGRWEERAIASHWSTDLIIITFYEYDAMLSTVIRQDRRKNSQSGLESRR